MGMKKSRYLIMEVLTARWRLGEDHWHFWKTFQDELQSLEDDGLIWVQNSSAPELLHVQLTDKGKEEWGIRIMDPRANLTVERLKSIREERLAITISRD